MTWDDIVQVLKFIIALCTAILTAIAFFGLLVFEVQAFMNYLLSIPELGIIWSTLNFLVFEGYLPNFLFLAMLYFLGHVTEKMLKAVKASWLRLKGRV